MTKDKTITVPKSKVIPEKKEQEQESQAKQSRLIVIEVGRDKIGLVRNDTASNFELIGVLNAILNQLVMGGSQK